MKRGALAGAALLVLGACGDDSEPAGLARFALPFALPVDCAALPADLEAEAWVSGSRASTALEVSVAEGTTTGRLRVTTGAERLVVVDWFVRRPGPDGEDVRVLLAQAARQVDLRGADDDVALAFEDDDVDVTDCRDVTGDVSRVGSDTQLFAGEQRPVCDLDESCAGAPAVDCSNLGELCAGEEPLVP